MATDYHLILKTGQSEMRAYKALSSAQKALVTPLVEMTRGRKNHKNTAIKTGHEFNFSAIREFVLSEIPPDQRFFIDVTRADSLSSTHTSSLRGSANGYQQWVNFSSELKAKKPNLVPVLQINPRQGETWDDYKDSLCAQFDGLAAGSREIAYRAAAKFDSTFDADLIAIKEKVDDFTAQGGRFTLFLDFEYIRPGTGALHALEAAKIIDAIHEIIPATNLILASTSFPNSVTDVGGEDYGEFNEEEVFFHEYTSQLVHNKFPALGYGDYGSINPIRSDDIVLSNGWRPRIDFPFSGNRIFYFREKRESEGKRENKVYLTTYSHHYRSVARNVVRDAKFLADPGSSDSSSWGVSQIREAAAGDVPSSSPSHWISVRMNIHIQQQLRRLGYLW